MNIKKFIKSFKYAFNGIFESIRKEQNLRFHIVVMILVIIVGIFLKINQIEWMICLILFGLVISAELFNTAIENAIDLIINEKNEKARITKDASAGAVLVLAIVSAIVGLMIFVPKILEVFL